MSVTPENTVNIYAAIFAGLSALAGIFAAVAAWRSANNARILSKAHVQTEKRGLSINLAKLGQEILSKAKSTNRLCDEVISQYNSLAVFTGSVGGSRPKLFKDRVEANRDDIAKIIKEVEEAHLTGESIDEMSEMRIGELLITYTMKREELLEIASVLAAENAELQSQLLVHQSEAIAR